MRIYTNGKERQEIAPSLNAPYNDSFYFLKAAVRKEIDVPPTDLSSLENNLMVVRILDAAHSKARNLKRLSSSFESLKHLFPMF